MMLSTNIQGSLRVCLVWFECPQIPDGYSLLREEGMLHSGKHGCVPTFLGCVAAIKVKKSFLNMVISQFPSFFFVLLWVNRGFMRSDSTLNPCILHLFTFNRESQLFGNWGSICLHKTLTTKLYLKFPITWTTQRYCPRPPKKSEGLLK